MIICKNCDTVTVYAFYKSIQDKDLRFLIRDYEEEYLFVGKELALSEKLENELKEAMNDIVNEYNRMNVDSKEVKRLKAEYNIEYLTGQYELANNLLNLYNEYGNIEILLVLKDLGFNIDLSKGVEFTVKQVVRRVKFLGNKIRIEKAKYANENKQSNEDKDLIKELRKRAILISSNLGLGTVVDIKKTSLSDWSSFMELNEEIVAQNG